MVIESKSPDIEGVFTLQKFSNLPDATALAEFAHRNQTDKQGLPYIEHPRRVLATVQGQGAPPYAQMAAILHDVTEDTKFTPEMLEQLGFSEAVVKLVKLVDRDYSLNQFYIANIGRDFAQGLHKGRRWFMSLGVDGADKFYYDAIKSDPWARVIKLADIEDNLQPWRLSYLEPATQARLKDKYARALGILDPQSPMRAGTIKWD